MKKFLSLLLAALMLFGSVLVVSAKEDYSVTVLEDAYVINGNSSGNQSNNNFGADAEIHLKTVEGSSLTRFGYLKFDVSQLIGDNDITCIDLELTLSQRQKDAGNPEFATVEVYGIPTDWTESSITFNDRPDQLGFITSNDKVSATRDSVSTFSITDYVKKEIAKGATEIALYLVEKTPTTNLHTRFHSKENGNIDKAPKLTVYHGTKTDSQVYYAPGDEPEVIYEYVPSTNGIDAFLGSITKISHITAKEDTYVEGGENTYINFGNSEIIDFKAQSGSSTGLYRIALFKFDISKLDKNNINKVQFVLQCTVMQDANLPVLVDVFSCDPYSWEEKKVTFGTKPDYEEFITTVEVSKKGNIHIDVTDYVKKAAQAGEKLISFYLDGDKSEPLRLNFHSTESLTENATLPMLIVTEGDLNFSTNVVYEGENPWGVAAEAVSTWFHRWEKIKARGDMETDVVVKDASEYSLTVDATNAGKTNGYETKYTAYPTRVINTLKGYDAATAAGETEKYDVYGGLMDESMKQEATGFFYTKKVGDRWWTFDPLGYPFYRVACVSISPGSSDKQKAAVKEVHGTNAAWAEYTTGRLFELGYNSLGGWGNIDNLSKVEDPLALTTIFYALNTYVGQAGLNLVSKGSTEMVGNVMPVFDPAFVTSTENSVKTKVAPYNTNGAVYGWMSDNELPDERNMLDSALSLDPSDSRFAYSYAAAWTFMYLKTGKRDVSLADVTDELRNEYKAMVYDRYFEVVCTALEKYAPYQQYMGCRFLANCYKNEYVMRVAGYWCDVISLNYYGAWEGDPTLMANMEKWSGKPFIITEWYAKGMDVWEADNRMTNQSGAGFTVRTQDDRGRFYQNYALMLMECKGCVGFDWFQYWDNDPDNLAADESNRNANKGIYSNNYEEYTVLTEYMDELNNQKYTLINFFDQR